jgi:hypothetical protein
MIPRCHKQSPSLACNKHSSSLSALGFGAQNDYEMLLTVVR